MKIKAGLTPRDGYRFRDTDGVVHEGESWAHLVRTVARYRATRGLPPGDPQREITEAVCQSDPKMCHNGPGELGDGDRDAFHLRVMDWVIKRVQLMRSKRLRFVDGIKAGERADTCRACPYQQSFQRGCASCSSSVGALQNQVVGGQAKVSQGLLACAILSEDTHISVHLEEPRLNNLKLPGHCWRKKV
jgi:hypothetical protein